MKLDVLDLLHGVVLQVQTFGVQAPCKTVEDLTNGVVMAQALQKM